MNYFIFILLLLGIFKIWDSDFSSNLFLNKFIKIIISSIVIASVLYYFIWNDYEWDDRIISKNNSDTSFNKLTEETDWELIKPYSWLKPYPIQVTYLDNHNFGRFNSKFYFARVLNLYKNNNNLNGTSIYLFDVDENKFCSLNEDKIQHLDFNKINLIKIEKNETRLLYIKDYLIKNVKPYYFKGMFGELYDISSAICSGQYYVNKTDTIISEIYSKNPVKLKKEDIELLRLTLNEYYPTQDSKINFESIKYDFTIYNYSINKLSDVYSINIFDKLTNKEEIIKFHLSINNKTKKEEVVLLNRRKTDLELFLEED